MCFAGNRIPFHTRIPTKTLLTVSRQKEPPPSHISAIQPIFLPLDNLTESIVMENVVEKMDGATVIAIVHPYAGSPRKVISMGLITAAALIPANPVPSPATKESMGESSVRKRIFQSVVSGAAVGFICGFIGAGGGVVVLQNYEYTPCCPVQRCGAGFIRKFCSNSCPKQRRQNTEKQARQIRQTPDSKMAGCPCKCRKRHEWL